VISPNTLSGLRRAGSIITEEGSWTSDRAGLLPHWGYENDPLAVSDVLATLRTMRTGQIPI
jgi:hypothetical protein